MAHEIYRDKNGKDCFAYVGEEAWHGLGTKMDAAATIADWEREAGFQWQIKERVAAANVPAAGDEEAFTIEFPERKLLYRSDTRAPLAIVGANYKVVQPKEILHFYEDLTRSAGFTLETAGMLFGGKRFWALAKINKEAQFVVPNDAVGGYLLLNTSCDGSLATSADFTSVRVVCNNTLTMSLREHAETRVRVPHNTTFDPDAVKAELGIGEGVYNQFMSDMRRLAAHPLTTGDALTALKEIVGDAHLPYEAQEPAVFKQIGDLYHLYSGAAMGADRAGQTSWGLLNAVTEWTDHHTRHRTYDARIASAWFGPNASLKRRAAEHLLEHYAGGMAVSEV